MNSVIIVAAGRGSRMKRDMNKAFIKIRGKEILAYTIETFIKHDEIDEIIVAVSDFEVDKVKEEIVDKYKYKNIKIVVGGSERQYTIYNSLQAVDDKADVILIHDGARPFIDSHSISRVIEAAKDKEAAIVAVPVTDTIKIVDGEGNISASPQRSKLWAAQTPQAFSREVVMKIHEKARIEGFLGTDDSMLAERMGYKVSIVNGSYENIKITTPEDLELADRILEKREALMEARIIIQEKKGRFKEKRERIYPSSMIDN